MRVIDATDRKCPYLVTDLEEGDVVIIGLPPVIQRRYYEIISAAGMLKEREITKEQFDESVQLERSSEEES